LKKERKKNRCLFLLRQVKFWEVSCSNFSVFLSSFMFGWLIAQLALLTREKLRFEMSSSVMEWYKFEAEFWKCTVGNKTWWSNSNLRFFQDILTASSYEEWNSHWSTQRKGVKRGVALRNLSWDLTTFRRRRMLRDHYQSSWTITKGRDTVARDEGYPPTQKYANMTRIITQTRGCAINHPNIKEDKNTLKFEQETSQNFTCLSRNRHRFFFLSFFNDRLYHAHGCVVLPTFHFKTAFVNHLDFICQICSVLVAGRFDIFKRKSNFHWRLDGCWVLVEARNPHLGIWKMIFFSWKKYTS